MRIKSKLKHISLLLVIISIILVGCGSDNSLSKDASDEQSSAETEQVKEVKVGFVYSSAADDGGWASAQERGRKYLEANLSGISTTIIENVSAWCRC
jgi:basic membrane lipoprotein Med (substrate-binding protein (PBP1-ABC) superfamily)